MTASGTAAGPTLPRAAGSAAGVAMRGIRKAFPGTVALDDVTLEVRPGEAHGLVGENGAGKSTLIKVLSGLYRADAGAIEVGGEAVSISSPYDAESHGIHVIHQDRQLVPKLSVAESLFLGKEEGTFGPFVNRRRLSRRAEEEIERHLGVVLPGHKLIANLSVAQQQLVQIARAVRHEPKVLILDEPTAPLAQREVDRLFGILRDLRSRDISIIYISHYLQEVEDLCERVTVLRNGRNAGVVDLAQASLEHVVTLMVGRDVEEFAEHADRDIGDRVRLQVRDLRSPGALNGVSLDVRAGEVVGVTGLIGSGADGLAPALMGVRPATGTVSVDGISQPRLSADALVRQGVAYVPADRRGEGLAVEMSVLENLTMPALPKLTRRGFIKRRSERHAAREAIGQLSIRPPAPELAVRDLSGGNQQKVVLGKWLVAGSEIYILDQPTSGVDIGSRAEIYRIINRLAESGAAVLMISQDLPELVGMSDRVLVMYRGRIAGEFTRDEATEDRVLAVSTGAEVPTTGTGVA